MVPEIISEKTFGWYFFSSLKEVIIEKMVSCKYDLKTSTLFTQFYKDFSFIVRCIFSAIFRPDLRKSHT